MTTLTDALRAALEEVRALHQPSRWYIEGCPDPAECEREHVATTSDDFCHSDEWELICATCSGLAYEQAIEYPIGYPCETAQIVNRALSTEADR